MRGVLGNGQHIQTLQLGYVTSGRDKLSLVPGNNQAYVHSFLGYNGNSSATDIGLGVSLANAASAFRVYAGAVSTVPAEVTTSVQAGTATTIVDTTTGHGFMIEAKRRFGYVTFTLSQAQTGSPVYVYEYWNGSAWSTLTTAQVASYGSTGLTYLTFNPPSDWAIGDGGTGYNGGYAIRVRATTAPTQAVQVTALRVAYWYSYRLQVPTQGQLQVIFDSHPAVLEAGEALVPYFSTASNANSVEVAFQVI